MLDSPKVIPSPSAKILEIFIYPESNLEIKKSGFFPFFFLISMINNFTFPKKKWNFEGRLRILRAEHILNGKRKQFEICFICPFTVSYSQFLHF